MASYPKATAKVLNPNGHVGMKEQMNIAACPHERFQKKGAVRSGGILPPTAFTKKK